MKKPSSNVRDIFSVSSKKKKKTGKKKGSNKVEYEMYKKNGKLFYWMLVKSNQEFGSIFGKGVSIDFIPKETQIKTTKIKRKTVHVTRKQAKKDEKEEVTKPRDYDKHFRFKRKKGKHKKKTKLIISDAKVTDTITNLLKTEPPATKIIYKVSSTLTIMDNSLAQGPVCFLHSETNKFLGVISKSFMKNVSPNFDRCEPENEFSIVESGHGENMYNIKKSGMYLGFDDAAKDRPIKLYQSRDKRKGKKLCFLLYAYKMQF